MVVVEVQRPGHGHEVAEAVKDRTAVHGLDPAQDMGVVADDDVRTGLDRGAGERPFVVGEHGRRVHDALVQRDDDQVRDLGEPLDVAL